MKPAAYVWQNGSMVPWKHATVHVLAHGLHYGSSVFEGIRSYATSGSRGEGAVTFRLRDHVRRLYDSARIYGMPMPFSRDAVEAACHDVVAANGLKSAYIRPIAYRGEGTMKLYAGDESPVEMAIAAFEWGAYLGGESAERGIDACVSSWARSAPNATPLMAKAGGHYLASQLVSAEARRNGYDEGLMLDSTGCVSEAASANIFAVRDGVVMTPPVSSSILNGVTRDTIAKLAEGAGYEVREMGLPREVIYTADEVFLTGTAAEVVPVRSVDGVSIGETASSGAGPVTRALQSMFFGLFDGTTEDCWGWLEPVTRRPAARGGVAPGREARGAMVGIAQRRTLPRAQMPDHPCPW